MANEKSLLSKLNEIQGKLVAPKTQFNSFGKYKYRSCEDILLALKEHLVKHGLVLTIQDDVVAVGDRIYVKATATITDGKDSFSTSALAREENEKKGMDASQITGTASSYARKYALNGLFAIDDTQDADALNRHGAEEMQERLNIAFDLLAKCKTSEEVSHIWRVNTQLQANPDFKAKVAEIGRKLKEQEANAA